MDEQTEFCVAVPIVVKVKCPLPHVEGITRSELAYAIDELIKKIRDDHKTKESGSGWEYSIDTYYDVPTADDGVFDVMYCDYGLFED